MNDINQQKFEFKSNYRAQSEKKNALNINSKGVEVQPVHVTDHWSSDALSKWHLH